MLTKTQAAYLAGLIDGEGSLECQKQIQKNGKTPRYVIRLSFGMVTHGALDAIAQWLDLPGPKRYPTKRPRWSDLYRLHIPANALLIALKACMPYLIEKRRQAEIAFEMTALRKQFSPSRKHYGKTHFQRLPPEWEIYAEPLYQEWRSLKLNKRPGCKGWS